MTPLEYLDYLVREKEHGIGLVEASPADVEAVRDLLSPAHYRQLHAYFERTLLTAKLQRAMTKSYYGYRIYVRGSAHQTPALRRTIWEGLDEGKQLAAAIRSYPVKAATGEWNWVVDAEQADTYHRRISGGWDRYSNIKVPRP